MLDMMLEANGMDEKGCPHGDGKGFLVLYECRITYLVFLRSHVSSVDVLF
jgi:hypothetical protein